MLTSERIKDIRQHLNDAQNFGQEAVVLFKRCSQLPDGSGTDKVAETLSNEAGDFAWRAAVSAGWFVEALRDLAAEFNYPDSKENEDGTRIRTD